MAQNKNDTTHHRIGDNDDNDMHVRVSAQRHEANSTHNTTRHTACAREKKSANV